MFFFLVLQFSVFPFSFYTIIHNYIFHAPRLFLNDSNWHHMSYNGSASYIAKNQDCIHSADPAGYCCHLTVSFYKKWERNAVVEGNWGQRTDGFGPRLCVWWRKARCVSLWLVSNVAHAESTAVYSSWNGGKMQSWHYSAPLKSHKTHTHTHPCPKVWGVFVCACTHTTNVTCDYTHSVTYTHCNYL